MQEMEGASSILKTMIRHILTKYMMEKKVVVQLIPHMLFPAQKQHCV